jgi:phosphoribosylformimino-5-aminoimidazole carboxamide ribotide isomerase
MLTQEQSGGDQTAPSPATLRHDGGVDRASADPTSSPLGGRFAVIPAVDVLGDEAVRLHQGDYARVAARAGDPAELVARFAAPGPPWIHVVDLDGARSGRVRPALVARLARRAGSVPLQVGGGVRSVSDIRTLLEAGARRIVIGTAAFAHAATLLDLVAELGERLVVALDVRAGTVRIRGWERAGLDLDDALARCRAAGVARVLCTAIARDGTLGGPDIALLERVAAASGCPVLAAGGVRDAGDLRRLAAAGLEGTVVGRALLAVAGAPGLRGVQRAPGPAAREGLR